MRHASRLAALAFAGLLVLGACTSGSTEVLGLAGAGTTGPTGPTRATAATGATGATSVTGTPGAFEGPVSLDISSVSGPVAEAAFFSCDGVLGTWTYLFKADFGGGVVFDIEAQVELARGAGVLEFGDEIDLGGGLVLGWHDTVDLEVTGTADAPALRSTNVDVRITGSVEGFPVETFKTFPENQEFPVLEGSDRC